MVAKDLEGGRVIAILILNLGASWGWVVMTTGGHHHSHTYKDTKVNDVRTDVNRMFNNFHNTFLRIFYSGFPEKRKTIHSEKKHSPWMTKGLKISINHKRDLYLRCKYSNDKSLINQNKLYCKILSKLIKLAKHFHYNKQISNSSNKPKTLWNIIKVETGKSRRKVRIPIIHNGGTIISDPPSIANDFNDYFLSAVDDLFRNKLMHFCRCWGYYFSFATYHFTE
jgi:hypothetical protein